MATGFSDQDIVQTRTGSGNYSTPISGTDYRFRFAAPYFSTQGGSTGTFYWDYSEIVVTLTVPDGAGNVSSIYTYSASTNPGSECYLDATNNLLWIKPSFITSWGVEALKDAYRFQFWYRPALVDNYNPTGISTLDITGMATQLQLTTRIAQAAFEMAVRSVQNPPEDDLFTGQNAPDQTNMLPKISERANKYLMFGPGGELIPVPASGAASINITYTSGGGSGGGEKNYIPNPNFETGSDSWATCLGTSGLPTLGMTTGAVNANLTGAVATNASKGILIAGLAEFQITKIAGSSAQSQGWYTEFIVDRSDLGGAMKAQISYKTVDVTNTYASDFSLYIIDSLGVILSTTVLPPTAGVATKAIASFFPSTQSPTQGYFRAVVMCTASTTTNAYTFSFDEVVVSPQTIPNAAAVGGWTASTLTLVSGAGNATSGLMYRRDGNSFIGRGWIKIGSTLPTGDIIFDPLTPLGLTASYALIPVGTGGTDASQVVGGGVAYDSDSGLRKSNFSVARSGTSLTSFYGLASDGAAYNAPVNLGNASFAGGAFTAGDMIQFDMEVPIAQWTTNVNLATDFTEYAATSDCATNVATDASFANNYNGIDGGVIGAFVPAGLASVDKSVRFKRAIQPSDMMHIEFWDPTSKLWISSVDAGRAININDAYTAGFGVALASTAGGTDVKVRFFSKADPGTAWSALTAGTRWRVRKVSNGNMAEVPSLIRAEYFNAAASALNTPINYQTKATNGDTHSAVTTGAAWKFTAPMTGWYDVIPSLYNSTAGLLSIYKGGVSQNFIGSCQVNILQAHPTSIYLLAGEYIDIRANVAVSGDSNSRIIVQWRGK